MVNSIVDLTSIGPGRADVTETKEMVDTILANDQDMMVTLPLKDLVWTIVNYNFNIRDIEEEIPSDEYDNIILNNQNHNLLVMKECAAAKADELARLISSYSDFNTRRIHDETSKIFKK
jgi:hypothetical protein